LRSGGSRRRNEAMAISRCSVEEGLVVHRPVDGRDQRRGSKFGMDRALQRTKASGRERTRRDRVLHRASFSSCQKHGRSRGRDCAQEKRAPERRMIRAVPAGHRLEAGRHQGSRFIESKECAADRSGRVEEPASECCCAECERKFAIKRGTIDVKESNISR